MVRPKKQSKRVGLKKKYRIEKNVRVAPLCHTSHRRALT